MKYFDIYKIRANIIGWFERNNIPYYDDFKSRKIRSKIKTYDLNETVFSEEVFLFHLNITQIEIAIARKK